MLRLTLGICVLTSLQAGFAQSETERPNIVFIVVDDLGGTDLPAYGHPFNETPNMDLLRQQGMLFTNAYASSPVCSSSRAAIFTGQHPARVGITDFIPGHWRPFEEVTVPRNTPQHLPVETPTMGELFKSAGYRTGYFGKWHLGLAEEHLPSSRGFDEAIVFRGWSHFKIKNSLVPKDPAVDDDVLLTDYLTGKTIDFIKQDSEQPFLVVLSHFAVHIPLQAEDATVQSYQEKARPKGRIINPVYAAMLDHVDQGIGRIIETLRQAGLADETMVVVYSDNGGLRQIFDKRDDVLVTDNYPLREEKGTLYEGGIRVPLIVTWPGRIQSNTTSDVLVSGEDMLPTFAELAGVIPPANSVMDGHSFAPALLGTRDRTANDTLYWHYPHYHHSEPASALRIGPYKLIHFYPDDRLELYNLEKDISESENLAGKEPERARNMLEFLNAWRKQVNASSPTRNEQFDSERRHEWGRHPDTDHLVKLFFRQGANLPAREDTNEAGR